MPDTDDFFKSHTPQEAIACQVRKATSYIETVQSQISTMRDSPTSDAHAREWARRQWDKLYDAICCLREIERRNGKAVKDA